MVQLRDQVLSTVAGSGSNQRDSQNQNRRAQQLASSGNAGIFGMSGGMGAENDVEEDENARH